MSEAEVRALTQCLAECEVIRQKHGLTQWVDGWSRSTSSGPVATDSLDVAQLAEVAEAGCRVELMIEVDRLRVQASAESSRRFVIEAAGEWADAARDDTSASIGAEAAAANDLQALLGAIRSVEAILTITVLAPTGDLAWVRTAETVLQEYTRAGWFAFAQLIAPQGAVARHLVVLDSHAEVVRSPALIVHGPNAWPVDEVPSQQSGGPAVAPSDACEHAPRPSAVMPERLSEQQTLAPVHAALEAVAGALAWLWLADAATADAGRVTIRLDGSRPIVGELPACPPEHARASVELWIWAAHTSQPARQHAVTQAVTLQVESPEDLFARAGSILDTAQFLYSLSQSGLVQEALAARRGARDAAVAAGRGAADRARAAARSAVDRVLVVVGAGVGVVLANKGELIDRPVGLGLLGLALGLTIGAALIVFHFDLPGAGRSVEIFCDELEQHAEVLSQRDIDAIRQLPSLLDGTEEVKRARQASGAIVGVAVVALVVLAALLLSGSEGEAHPPTSITTTTSTTSTSTSSSTTSVSTTISPAPPGP